VTVEVTRARFGSLLEWAFAALCAALLVAVAARIASAVRTTPDPIVPVAAQGIVTLPALSQPPAAVPSGVVSVPLIQLKGGGEVRVGDAESAVTDKLRSSWRAGDDVLERGADGNRVTRAYDDGTRRFLLVLEPSPGGAERHVSAIYMR
jgi:hypothetical protein